MVQLWFGNSAGSCRQQLANQATTAKTAKANNVYFAVVNGTGAMPALIAGSPGVSVDATRPGAGTGLVTVNFP